MRLSWDEALDLMANRFSEIRDHYGPEADNDIYQESDAVQLIRAAGVTSRRPSVELYEHFVDV